MYCVSTMRIFLLLTYHPYSTVSIFWKSTKCCHTYRVTVLCIPILSQQDFPPSLPLPLPSFTSPSLAFLSLFKQLARKHSRIQERAKAYESGASLGKQLLLATPTFPSTGEPATPTSPSLPDYVRVHFHNRLRLVALHGHDYL